MTIIPNQMFPTRPVQTRRWRCRALIAVAAVLVAAFGAITPSSALAADAQAGPSADDERPVIGIEHEGPIRVVFQITSDDMKDGVGKGLLYLKKLHDGYLAAGVDPTQLDIRAVYHGAASDHLLTDQAWNRERKASSGNPNTALIGELTQRGVHLELCNTRRISNGWSKSDIHPDVLLVRGAYQRIIDLQIRGYAYIRF